MLYYNCPDCSTWFLNFLWPIFRHSQTYLSAEEYSHNFLPCVLLHRYLAYYLTTDFKKLLHRFLKLLFISPSSLVFSPPNSSCLYLPHLHALSFLLGSSFLYHHLKSSFKQETMSIIVLISFIFSMDHLQIFRIWK